MPRKKKSSVKSKKKNMTAKKKLQKKPGKKASKKRASKTRKKKAAPIPKGYNSVTAYLFVTNGANAIDFYKKAFGAKEVMRMERDNKIGHAELKIGDTKIMLADESPEMDARSPQAYGGSPVGIHLYVKNVDDIMERALASGAKLTRAIEDMFYGDRSGALEDPFGHKWYVSTHVEDVTRAQMRKRMAEMQGGK